ncbi:medium-chain acyl-[acyl-carrier-protein] hydrolase [Silvibacterium bohemicum]|uniref:Medium-chain acyl-[acyl-carrier-protein] hydrolase n=1 Tax=Silvibacterium bohemicum TaxID=1577686 RepID=A0A841JVE8_9BACT|nr:alpha/beta fold hydrolase [Silvibacterium bohemicum]MBB6145120.1 medium-chain acyl-[acyl-carrier-protein] hydrolase [Silvibacterium bohemicum]
MKQLRPAPDARIRLFCFPAAGASANSYWSWGAALPPFLEAFGIQLPGRGERFHEEPTRDMQALVAELAQATRPLRDRPFVFLGHSLGTLIAFELARTLRRNGERLPLHFYAAAHRAPQTPETDPPAHRLPDAQFVERLRELGGSGPEILAEQELMELLMPTLRADFAMDETYSYTAEPPLACPITAWGGSEDAELSPEDLALWQHQTASSFELQIFQGNHFFVHSQLDALVGAIEARLRSYSHT